jgi:hypothetical protein
VATTGAAQRHAVAINDVLDNQIANLPAAQAGVDIGHEASSREYWERRS